MSDILFENKTIASAFYGDKKVTSIYYGSKKVWPQDVLASWYHVNESGRDGRKPIVVASSHDISQIVLKDITAKLTMCYCSIEIPIGLMAKGNYGDVFFGKECSGSGDTVITIEPSDGETVITFPSGVKSIVMNLFNDWNYSNNSQFYIKTFSASDVKLLEFTAEYGGNMTGTTVIDMMTPYYSWGSITTADLVEQIYVGE